MRKSVIFIILFLLLLIGVYFYRSKQIQTNTATETPSNSTQEEVTFEEEMSLNTPDTEATPSDTKVQETEATALDTEAQETEAAASDTEVQETEATASETEAKEIEADASDTEVKKSHSVASSKSTAKKKKASRAAKPKTTSAKSRKTDEKAETRGIAVVPSANRYALLIGVDKYSKPINSLQFCGKDMMVLAESLQKSGVPIDNILLMTDHSGPEMSPSGSNIRKQIEIITQLMEPEDQLIVAFSGHGVMVDGESYLCPSDSNLKDKNSIVSREWVFDQLDKCPAKQKIFIIDACRDEITFEGGKSVKGVETLSDPVGADTHGFILIASCDKYQQSWEHVELEQGVFSHYFAEALAGAARDEDGYVSIMAIFQYASSKTKKYVYKKFNQLQVPTFRQSSEMTDFCIAKIDGPIIIPDEEEWEVKPLEKRKAGDLLIKRLNGVEYRFHWCPPGKFMMGSNTGEENEKPVHEVELTKGFWMLEIETTQQMWSEITGSNPCESNGKGVGPDYAVFSVNWVDCLLFCEKFREKHGLNVQLPTEAQWEYACRAGTTGDFPDDPDYICWDRSNASYTFHETKQKRPNPWGLYDMNGGTPEWCSDWYDPNFYAKSPKVDPENTEKSDIHVYRSGHFADLRKYCRSSSRNSRFDVPIKFSGGFRFILLTE